MKRVEVLSYPISIFMAGDYDRAVALCQLHCDENPWCVTVTPTAYVYTGGMEAGVVVGLINYPRFPNEPRAIWNEAQAIAARLCEGLEQQSYTIQAPDKTIWYSHRGEHTPASKTQAAEVGRG